MFDEDQIEAFNLIKDGHNLLVSGQAGAGKTFLIKKAVKYLRKHQRKADIVCSTGIAATHFSDLGAQTLHRWAGIEDGRHMNQNLLHLIETDERFISVKKNFLNVDVLFIDEISMISSKVLSQVEFLIRNVRKSNQYFGGAQIVLVGDFYQLPPVPNELLGDPGNHCFRISWFNDCFPHQIILHLINRQSDHTLIKCINELEIGNPSDETLAFLNSLNRPTENEHNAVQLFAWNLDVDLFNYNKLQSIPGDLKVYHAQDQGSEHYLNKMLAPKNLGIKNDCSIMLVKNLSESLVNGLRGKVTKLYAKSVDVEFMIDDKSVTTNVTATDFTVFDPVDKIAKRTQLPLKLAYAMTIHKSQGMTLKNLVVNCENSKSTWSSRGCCGKSRKC